MQDRNGTDIQLGSVVVGLGSHCGHLVCGPVVEMGGEESLTVAYAQIVRQPTPPPDPRDPEAVKAWRERALAAPPLRDPAGAMIVLVVYEHVRAPLAEVCGA